ncbi:VH1-INTERACTING KINASE-like [Klebsormidium nitens]|uniref:non-specific serine/threonine protein kinase n=1 Tax=Klebsormidium nitens TaxID=105231 RepID=A0A1Y1INX4_KLENI|nr:VH1-INTERACTING KINASE-like [Klebsormidium nitens]|eukprot:GAQ89818.1 VH1-INTERACTING KINASE-like [Klebsormidium nitens]
MEAPGPVPQERWPGVIDLNQAAPQDDLPSVSGTAHENELRGRSSPSANGASGQSDGAVGRSRRQSGSPLEIDAISRMLYFASQGSVEDIQAMLDDGADVNSHDYDGRSALHLAASEGKLGAVQLLLERGARVNPLDRWGGTPLSDALHFGFQPVADLLRSRGGHVINERLSDGKRFLTNPPQRAYSSDIGPEWELDPAEVDWRKSFLIGKGAFGEIRLASWRGTRVAVKSLLPSLSHDEQVELEFFDELRMLCKLRHPNIVQSLGVVTHQRPLMLLFEYLPKGDLADLLSRKGALPAATAIRYALDIARGMNYLHLQRPNPVLHRDLKPRNLLLDESGHLKVADFGLSKLLTTDAMHEQYKMTGETGTYRYMAPEVFRHETYDKSVDVFSFAVILQEMFEGGPAWRFTAPEEVARQVALRHLRPPFKASTYPLGVKELIQACWASDARLRPTFSVIIERLEEIEEYMAAAEKALRDGYPLSQLWGLPGMLHHQQQPHQPPPQPQPGVGHV